MTGNQPTPGSPGLPPLLQIEKEGAKAARALAQSILRETLANNGAVNLARLERAGPEVRTAYLRLLAYHAAAPSAQTPGPTRQKTSSDAKAAPPSQVKPMSAAISKSGADAKRAGTQSSSTPTRRAYAEWMDGRREQAGFQKRALTRGMGAALAAAALAVLILQYFQL